MSTSAEITCTIQNDSPSITFRVSAQGEGNSTPDLCGMLCQIQKAVTEFQKTPQAKFLSNSEAVVQDAPHPAPAMQSPQIKSFSSNKGKGFSQKGVQPQSEKPDTSLPGTISQKQIGKIRVNLKFRNIPEKVFCTSHGIARIEDLSGKYAWEIIDQEDY